MPSLADPLRLGRVQLKHRIAMAPLTRFRADDNHVHQPIAQTYYAQRASVPGTLIITEATFIAPQAGGYHNVPGIWSKEQIEQWSLITEAVHKKKSFIFLQLWALGRAAYPDVLREEGGYDVVSSSPTPMTPESPVPRELTESEIKGYVGYYAIAAKNAIEAGFDGVEIHGANGYIIDQFTQDTTNKRTDKYGGSIENRARFGLEVAQAVVDAVGAERVGIRLSPFSYFQGMKMDDPIPQFSYLIQGLKKLRLAYVHLVDSRISGWAERATADNLDFAVDIWDNISPIIICGGLTQDSAQQLTVRYPNRDIITGFGRYFISNPDLPYRFLNKIEFAKYNRDTFYTPKSPVGYIDYPFSAEFESESRL